MAATDHPMFDEACDWLMEAAMASDGILDLLSGASRGHDVSCERLYWLLEPIAAKIRQASASLRTLSEPQ